MGEVGGGPVGEVGGGPVGEVGGGPVDDVGGPAGGTQTVSGGEPGSPDETPTLTFWVSGKLPPGSGFVQMTVPACCDDASTADVPRVMLSSASAVVTCGTVCPMTYGMVMY